MNQTTVVLCGLVLAATIIGVSSFQDVADRYYSYREQVKSTPARCPASELEPSKTIIGHSETVFLGQSRELVYDAKVDSGAESSSLHATQIHTFVKNIKEQGAIKELLFVRFQTRDDLGRERSIERMVSRIDQVKNAIGVSTRYFFHETIWVNERSYDVEISLADRSNLSKKMLLGKNLLNQGYLIDTEKAYVVTHALVSR